jgi:hypothetical protein
LTLDRVGHRGRDHVRPPLDDEFLVWRTGGWRDGHFRALGKGYASIEYDDSVLNMARKRHGCFSALWAAAVRQVNGYDPTHSTFKAEA